MAIIPDVPYVKVDVVVDGRALPEYLDEDDEDSLSYNEDSLSYDSTIKYVESTTGSKFFEDVSSSKPRPELKDLGTITAEFRVGISQKEEHYEKPYHDTSNKPTVGHENVHEKHLKGQAISQQAKLGDPSCIPELNTVRVRYLNDCEPFATFQFRYRSRRDLQNLCLIPRRPSPVPLEDRPEESLSREELLELLRRQEARQEEQITIKRELKRERVDNDESDDELVVVSSRPPASKVKTSVNVDTGVETIDLTDD
ncbi:hypothetical protein E4T42_01510 [Aureobasidium subglaciale]|nr:hypothetical protein E4T42_01510 [Aureobasidium subglaciale]